MEKVPVLFLLSPVGVSERDRQKLAGEFARDLIGTHFEGHKIIVMPDGLRPLRIDDPGETISKVFEREVFATPAAVPPEGI